MADATLSRALLRHPSDLVKIPLVRLVHWREGTCVAPTAIATVHVRVRTTDQPALVLS